MPLRLDRDTLVTIGFHLLMLLGVWFYGWSAYSLLVLYWLETLVVGFWTILFVAVAPTQTIRLLSNPSAPARSGPAIALFVLVHAGMFMGVHLFFLHFVFGERLLAPRGPLHEEIIGLIVDGRLWLPLAGLFVIRALTTFDALRRHESIDRQLVGFYFRIVVMQLAILGGGFLLVFLGVQAALIMLVIVRIGFELAIPSVEDYVEAHVEKLHVAASPPHPDGQ